ncbi:imidazole glycerol phosphate synthase subunit HisH [Novilysobacter erysipheiresistens]|uniref:Imidazole glycerol phosphate synthase subunit HisH n=1 Tax=Novilysobacter erysipheiresistens TaxID=1749332 RepID=A0ABU7YV33_9GAMM
MIDVVLIDGGGANLGSVRYALERLGARVRISVEPAVINSAARVILPGVGAAAVGMARLHELGLVEVIRTLRQPLLGICLGMQLMYESSEEGDVECLGLVPGRVTRLAPRDRITDAPAVRVPHMGWNRLRAVRGHGLLADIDDGAQAYFVHGYAAPVGTATLAIATHGCDFSAVVGDGLRFGAQFHPERSAAVGARLLRNFLSEAIA